MTQEHRCIHESDVKRMLKVLDGNGKDGLIREHEIIKKSIEDMHKDIRGLVEVSTANAKGISGFNQYIQNEEVLKDLEEKREKKKNTMLYFVIGQSVVVALSLLGLFLK